jgi:hypothetical protein
MVSRGTLFLKLNFFSGSPEGEFFLYLYKKNYVARKKFSQQHASCFPSYFKAHE